MIRKISVILVFGLFFLSATGALITEGKESLKIYSVDINTTDLVWGPYICNIPILSNGGNGVFTVTVNILSEGFTNITVYEAWEFLNDTGNGIQIPVDVRTDGEWNAGFIDTPFPESPIHYCLALLQDETGLQEFLDLYDGEDVILYCAKGGRSFIATKILINANFTGTIYNMVGGIIAWEEAGFPVRGNEPPNKPTITGETQGKAGEEYEYIFKATDPDEDGVKYFIDWDDGTPQEETGYSPSGEEVTASHSWIEQGTYIIRAKAKDTYGAESDRGTLTVTMPVNQQGSQQSSSQIFLQVLERLLNLR